MSPEQILVAAVKSLADAGHDQAKWALAMYNAANERSNARSAKSLVSEDCAAAIDRLAKALTINGNSWSNSTDDCIRDAMKHIMMIQGNLVKADV